MQTRTCMQFMRVLLRSPADNNFTSKTANSKPATLRIKAFVAEASPQNPMKNSEAFKKQIRVRKATRLKMILLVKEKHVLP